MFFLKAQLVDVKICKMMLAYFAGVSLFGGPKASSVLNIPEANSFHHEYGALACTVEIVEDVNTAIEHIHRHGRQVTFFITIQC